MAPAGAVAAEASVFLTWRFGTSLAYNIQRGNHERRSVVGRATEAQVGRAIETAAS